MKDYETYWGIDSNHHQPVVPNFEQDSLGERLSSIRQRKCDCSDWLQELAQNYNCTDTVGRQYRQERHTESLIVYWVRALFESIRQCADKFNQQLNSDHLMVEYVEPEFHRVECSANETLFAVQRIFYECHFVANRWALLLRGVDNRLDAFIVPSDVWLGLSINTIDDSQYPSFFRIDVDSDNGLRAIVFSDDNAAGNLPVDSASIPGLAKLLFSRLIEVSLAR